MSANAKAYSADDWKEISEIDNFLNYLSDDIGKVLKKIFHNLPVENLRNAFEKGTLKEFVKNNCEEWKNVPLNIGIIGESGSGKSSFINTIRGLAPEDVGAAAVGVTETTFKPTPYHHPNNLQLQFWDLPGVNTPNFPQESYFQKIDFDQYDFFIIVSATRFTCNDLWLAFEIKLSGKKFLFIRTKVQTDVTNDKRDRPKTHNPGRLMAEMRENIKENLGELFEGDNVFLIDNHFVDRYEFAALEEKIIDDFPELKKEALVYSMSSLCEGVIRKKANFHQGRIWSVVNAIFLENPGIRDLTNFDFLMSMSHEYHTEFGLDLKSLEKTARLTNSDPYDLKRLVCEHFGGQNFPDEAWFRCMIDSMSGTALVRKAEDLYKMVVPFGKFIVSPITLATSCVILDRILTIMEEIALKVLLAARQANFNDDID